MYFEKIKKKNIKKKIKKDKYIFRKLKKIYDFIPKNRRDLFKIRINFRKLKKYNIIKTTFYNWVTEKSIEIIGEKQDYFINLVMEYINKEKKPRKLVSKLERILLEEAEDFVKKIWRFLIFEEEKLYSF